MLGQDALNLTSDRSKFELLAQQHADAMFRVN